MIYGHGDDLFRYGDKIKYNFSSNIVSGVSLPDMREVAGEALDSLCSYPSPEPLELERDIADYAGVSPEEVMATNGATEAIYLIARAMAGSRSFVMAPSFREYQDACLQNGHNIEFFRNLPENPAKGSVVWICNPNNPTGTVIDPEIILDAAHRNPSVTFVIDQAYSDYSVRNPISSAEAVEAGNMILLGSLTKRFSVPGLRLGYAVAARPLLNRIRSLRMPWSIGAFSEKVGRFLIRRASSLPIDSGLWHEELIRISKVLLSLGITSSESGCNFALFQLPAGSATGLKDFLVDRYGILIRDASNFEGLDHRYFRIAAQTAEANDLLIEGVAEYVRLQKTLS